jgi:3-oxo-5-alpha-steroid 4-dehydrogenase 3
LPTMGLFCIVACPHYLMEIGIYLSMALVYPQSLVLWACFVWTAINLSVSAEQTRYFYLGKFDHRVPKYAIFPNLF